jgi:glycosyltransferase involved in cell wall biosynthesis
LNSGNDIELTILLPCLNEALTVQACVQKARQFLKSRDISGEILVADNGSTDGSQSLAQSAGASVVAVRRKGYGAALTGGIEAARGRFVIMADADGSYDLANLDAFVDALRAGAQLVMGNRFKGGIKPGAMPLMNRYLGNPALSLVGRTLFGSPIGDFHCGIRGFDRLAIRELDLRASGMEFASEMVVKASLAKLSMREVPTTLSPDGRQRPPHLRPWRDGWRHLRFMLLRSPNWLFLYPGLMLMAVGALGAILLTIKPLSIMGILTLDVDALLYFSVAAIVGSQITFFGLFALAIARQMHLRVTHGFADKLLRVASLEGSLATGLLLMIAGVAGALYAFIHWQHQSFGALVPSEIMRVTIPSVALIAIGVQLAFGAFMLGFIEMDGRTSP